MKKAKTIILTILIVLCCGVWCGAKIYGAMLVEEAIKISIDRRYHKAHPFLIYNEVWGIDIPEENAQLEYKFSDIEWMDGERYAIVKFDTRPDELLESLSNEISDRNLDRLGWAIESLIKNGIDESKVVNLDENYPIYVKEKHYDHLFLLYDENTNTLYIVESFL